MEKIDYKKELKDLYKPSAKKVDILDVPEMNFIMIDGAGDPNTSQEFQEAVEALFSISYTLKFMVKKGVLGIDYGVLPLEGLWWTDDISQFNIENKDNWKWTLMIMQPEYATRELFHEAVEKVHNFIKESGFNLAGKHHEIYLSDIRKAAPEKWKTIIRQPIV